MLIYHNPRCRKSRETLQLLQEKGVQPETRLYLEDNPNKKELEEVVRKLGIPAEKLVRKSEAIFKEKYKGRISSEREYIQAMVDDPKLIERPIVIEGNRAVIGRPPESVLALLA
jgi:arsenate reductase (glutaredoxin)